MQDISREFFDQSDTISYTHNLRPWLHEDVIRFISSQNHEPQWMLEHRLKSLEIFRSLGMPNWGPDLSDLDLESIYYFAQPEGANDAKSWDDVPDKIKNTFERLGIPEAERTMLAWVGAQYDSQVVYHSLKEEIKEKGVIFEDMSIALRDHEDIVRKHFMRAVPSSDHKFAALHGAVWSGGTFLYIPKNVEVSEPLQAYFRMNVKSGGQFEHTLIVLEEGAHAHYIEGCSAPKYGTNSLHAWCVEIYVGEWASMRYSSVENWSIDTYNLNTKRAIVQKNASMEWVGGNLGSGTTMLYPASVLLGDYSSARHIGVAFANTDMESDTGAKVTHIGKYTRSQVTSKSLSKWGGRSTYRGLINIKPSAIGSVSNVDCDGLILDASSKSDTYPEIRIANNSSQVTHEAKTGSLSEEALFYLSSRWLSEDLAKNMIVGGFLSPITAELPLEYAMEMNALIQMEMEGI
jgi:Fe-S cluster assembly protein SufB